MDKVIGFSYGVGCTVNGTETTYNIKDKPQETKKVKVVKR